MTVFEKAVEGQLLAYNAHDLEGFLSWYTDDVEGHDLDTGAVLFTSKAEMAPRYVERFKDKQRHCVVVNRMVLHRTVVDHERLTTSGGPLEAIAIYDVTENGLIRAVRFSMGRVESIR